MPLVERSFPAIDPLAAALAAEIIGRLTQGVAARGRAAFLATGGTTPAPVYRAMAALDAPWSDVEVTLSDERWVAVDDPGSNEGMVRASLLQGRASAARLVGLKTADPTPKAAEADVSRKIEAIARPFDVAVLGMGEDGHVASLFPHAPELVRALDDASPDFVCAVDRPDAAGAAERLSMTRRALLDCRWIVVLIRGEAKRAVLRRALAGDDPVDMPIRIILRQHLTPVEVWWAP